MTDFLSNADEMNIVSVKIYFHGSELSDLEDDDIDYVEIRYLVTNQASYLRAVSLKNIEFGYSFTDTTYEQLCAIEKERDLKRQDSLSPEREIIPAFQAQSRGAGVKCKHFNNGEPYHLYEQAHSYHITYSHGLENVTSLFDGAEVPLTEPQLSEFKLLYEYKGNIDLIVAQNPISYVSRTHLKIAQNKPV